MADTNTVSNPDNSPVNVTVRSGEVQGQAQSEGVTPSNGLHTVHETSAVTDYVVTDANSPLAVQIPEGVGASTVGVPSPLGQALAGGTVEEQFARANEDADQSETHPDAVQTPEQAEATSGDASTS